MRPKRSPSERDSREKIGNAIDPPDLLHRLFINHGDCIVEVG